MDAARRAELEQEKAKLLIELEAVAASHAVWEQAFQKATLEQERMKKEEQQLIQRRDMLRMLVDAASDQAYRAEEDYRKLRAEGPLIAAAKVEETERLQSLRQLVHETHVEHLASYQEMTQKFNDAPWVQALKKKEELLARTKQQVKEKEAEAAELAVELTRLRELVDDEIENPTCAFVAEVAALEQRLVLLRVQKDEEQRMAVETQIFNSPNRRRSDATTPQKRTHLAEPPIMHGTPNALVRRIPPRPNIVASANRTPGSAKKSVVDPLEIIQPTPSPPPKRRSQLTQRSDTSLLLEREQEQAQNDSQQLSPEEETVDESYAEHHNNSARNSDEIMEVDDGTSPPDSGEIQEGTGSQESLTNGDIVADSDPDAHSFHFNLSGNTTNSAAVRSTSPVFAVPELPERFQIQNSNNKKKNQNQQNRNSTVESELNASAGDGNSDFFNILENATAGGDEDEGAAAFSFLNSQSSNTQHSNDGGFNFNFDDDDNNDDNNDGGSGGFFF
uniref:Rab5-bind domain-containing protein n=1 Tax=Panagrellus redivivus TaxID=6233 RepID=A0A7E4V0G4_PANRE